MPHLLFWLSIIAFALLLAAFFLSLREHLASSYAWTGFYLSVLLGLSVWSLLSTVDYYIEIFIAHGGSLERRIDALIGLAAAGAILYSYFHFTERLVFRQPRRTAVIAFTLGWSAWIIASLLFIFVQSPSVEFLLVTGAFGGVSACSLAALLRRRRWKAHQGKEGYLPLLVWGVLLFPALMGEILLSSHAGRAAAYFPAALLSVPFFCIGASLITISSSLRRRTADRSQTALAAASPSFCGDFGITPREKEIIEYLLAGLSAGLIGK